MSNITLPCQNLADQVNRILKLVQKEASLRIHQNISAVETSLAKAISPKFEIVFAGAFSAGKSMLINALLERELLYSAEGHATGIECYIEYANPHQERVVLTFLSEIEIREQVNILTQLLKFNLTDININQPHIIDKLNQECENIIASEGGESKSERAKQANALRLLLDGFELNRDHIHTTQNAIYSMEQFNFNNLSEAANYARRGSNSAVLKKLEYYCFHPLLEDGNVLIDLPGIDAPVKKDAELTYRKIEDSNTSAVVCVLKPASAGDMTKEETELMEKMSANSSIRDRVFYVFNRIDETWYNTQLRQRLENLIQTEFKHTNRLYKTSGLLGFYGSQVKQTTGHNRFGLDTIFADSVKSLGGGEDTPQFVSAFNNYCANSGKLTRSNFKVSVNSYETPNENYIRILSEWGNPLIEQLISDSGIEYFKEGITRYLTEEKRPQLYANLADDLQPICINLRNFYLTKQRELDSQPQEIESMKAQELSRLNQELQDIGKAFYDYIQEEINDVIINKNKAFEQDFQILKTRMVNRLDELLQTFSVEEAYSRATKSHPRNAVAPLIAVLVEALYSLANDLEDLLIAEVKTIITNFSEYLSNNIQEQNFYSQLYRLLGDDGGIEDELNIIEKMLLSTLESEAKTECDRYVRESASFYDEGTFSIYQFRQTIQQTSEGYDVSCMIEAEPAIRQLLKLDFEPKVNKTIRQTFRHTINNTIKTQLLPMATKMADNILQQYSKARANLEQTLEQEAAEKIAFNQQSLTQVNGDIDLYNEAINSINNCLKAMQLSERKLPLINIKEENNEQ